MTGFTPEVLIYIQSVKNYFSKNEQAKNYFLANVDDELFFTHLGKISQKNYEDNGEVMLNINQFELLRKTVLAIAASKNELRGDDVSEHSYDLDISKVFIDFGDYGKISLN